MKVNQLSVFVENKKGRLAEILSCLADHSVDILALSLADTSEFGVLRLIVDQPEQAKALLRERGVIVKITEVLAVEMEHIPGGAAKILSLLSDGDVALEYMYACTAEQDGKAIFYARVDDMDRAQALLRDAGYVGA